MCRLWAALAKWYTHTRIILVTMYFFNATHTPFLEDSHAAAEIGEREVTGAQ